MAANLEDIHAFLRLSACLATAGQPLESEFALIKDAGYEVVVNLVPPDAPNALLEEEELVTTLGLDYVAIPVVWSQPEIADLERFFSVMDASQDKNVFVHCAANMRVSAFVYLYRTLKQNVSPAEAEKDLHRIWVPNERWSRFIEDAVRLYEKDQSHPALKGQAKSVQSPSSQ